MSLTIHQNEVMNQVIDAVKTGSKRILLKGSAGVGKTFMVNELVKQFGLASGGTVFLTAPTNKALAVLRSKIHVRGNIEFATIHSALKLKRKFNNKTGDVFFKQEYSEKFPPFKNCSLLIIDESSMVNRELLGYLKQYDFPIIFIGDEKQLNPVKEQESPVFHQNWLAFELTEIIRQGEGNPIIKLSRNIPLIWEKVGDTNEQDLGYTYTYDRSKIIERLAQTNGTDELKYLAYTNQEVDITNSSVRKTIYGTPRMIEGGEILVFNAPYGDSFYTNQELKIEKLVETYETFEIKSGERVEFKIYIVNDLIKVVHEESIKDYKNIIASIKKRCKSGEFGWKMYYGFIEQFADFKYNHAITVHKSQGSTYKDVILNVSNLNINKNKIEKQRLFYTGITRASDLLILYNV